MEELHYADRKHRNLLTAGLFFFCSTFLTVTGGIKLQRAAWMLEETAEAVNWFRLEKAEEVLSLLC